MLDPWYLNEYPYPNYVWTSDDGQYQMLVEAVGGATFEEVIAQPDLHKYDVIMPFLRMAPGYGFLVHTGEEEYFRFVYMDSSSIRGYSYLESYTYTGNHPDGTQCVGSVYSGEYAELDFAAATLSFVAVSGPGDTSDPNVDWCVEPEYVGRHTLTGTWIARGGAPHSVMLFGPAPVPLPATLTLLGAGLAALGAVGLRRRERAEA